MSSNIPKKKKRKQNKKNDCLLQCAGDGVELFCSIMPTCWCVWRRAQEKKAKKNNKKRPAVKKGKTDFCAVTKIPEYHHHHISAEQSFVTS